jgi:hypothetical protein
MAMSLSYCLSRAVRVGLWAAVAALLVAGQLAVAAEPEGEKVELFEAIEAGQIEARFIPRDSTRAQLLLTNKTKQPLSVALPTTFSAVPVLAQFNDPFAQQGNQGNSAPQNVGGGFPPMGGGQMNVAGPGGGGQNPWLQQPGFMSVPAEKVGKLKLATVCLSFGQPNPRAKFPYELRPLADTTAEPGVAEVCAMLARGKVSQRVAQLAAWHLANDKPWEELAGLRDKAAIGTRPRYGQKELATAKKLVEEAVKAAEKPTSESLSAAR